VNDYCTFEQNVFAISLFLGGRFIDILQPSIAL